MPKDVIHDIGLFLGLKIKEYDAKIDMSSVALSVTELPQHYSKRVVKCALKNRFKNDRELFYVAVVGDSAAGLSFYKGVNTGIQSGTTLAKTTVRYFPRINEHVHSGVDLGRGRK
jgi:thiamine monophosphate kinase